MSGKRYEDGSRTIMWERDWYQKSELDSASDTQSQYSEETTCDSTILDPAETPDVRARMRKLFVSQSFTDVTFFSKNNRRISISAHRAILAVGSPVFKKILFDDQNKSVVGRNMEVPIGRIPFDAFICIVKYLYTDEISLDNEALIQGIFDGAKHFDIYSLVNKCNEYFESVELTIDNVCSKLQTSTSNNIVVVKERCIEFIQRNTLPVIQSTDFHKCSSTTVRAICKLQSLTLRSEMELLEAVMRWLGSQSLHERKSFLEPLLKCIRFLSLTVGEMSDTLKKYPDLMPAEEGLSIILFMHNRPKNPDFTGLPSWLNKNIQSRCVFEGNVHAAQTGLNDADPNSKQISKISFPLKPDPEQVFVPKLTSLLQMKCINGFHEIKAIRLSFERPVSNLCRINSLSIKVHLSPSGFNTTENLQMSNSESVRVEFRKIIKVRRGDTLDIDAEAKNIEGYKFLQFDKAHPKSTNPHFSICLSSIPKEGKLYFLSEIEYGPQGRPTYILKKIHKQKQKKNNV